MACSPASTVGPDVTHIGLRAFNMNDKLTNITVSASNPVYSGLGGVLFDKALTQLIQYPGGKSGNYTVPQSVNAIGFAAFYACPNLGTVTLGANVTSIDTYAFSWCPKLDLVVSVANPSYSTLAGLLFDKTKTTLVACPASQSGSYTVLSGVTHIAPAAFLGCAKLTSVTLPPSVHSIGQFAFKSCSALTAAYFQGDAPTADSGPADPPFEGSTIFYASDQLLVYYLPGTTGWDMYYGGRPTALNTAP